MDHHQSVNLLNIQNPESLALLFIEQFQKTGSLVSESDWLLLNALIDDENVPEEYAQMLLCIQVVSLMAKSKTDAGKSFDVALGLLDKLSDPNYRLTCLTNTYFQLVCLKADILGAQRKYELVLDYIQGIYELHAMDSEFNKLSDAERIRRELKIKMAIAAHLGAQQNDLSYVLFSETLLKDKSFSRLSVSNCNVFIIFGYVCFSLGKYEEAMQAFDQISGFIDINQHVFPAHIDTKDLKQEAIAMRLIAQKSAHKAISKEDFGVFCQNFSDTSSNMSDKNKHLKELVVKLYQLQLMHSVQPMTPMYTHQKSNKGTQFISGSTTESISNNKAVAKNGAPRYG